jgi:hypothetical protein
LGDESITHHVYRDVNTMCNVFASFDIAAHKKARRSGLNGLGSERLWLGPLHLQDFCGDADAALELAYLMAADDQCIAPCACRFRQEFRHYVSDGRCLETWLVNLSGNHAEAFVLSVIGVFEKLPDPRPGS